MNQVASRKVAQNLGLKSACCQHRIQPHLQATVYSSAVSLQAQLVLLTLVRIGPNTSHLLVLLEYRDRMAFPKKLAGADQSSCSSTDHSLGQTTKVTSRHVLRPSVQRMYVDATVRQQCNKSRAVQSQRKACFKVSRLPLAGLRCLPLSCPSMTI